MKLRVLMSLLALSLAGCAEGELTLRVTDAPIDGADEVQIRFTGVELEREEGDDEIITFDPPLDIDVLSLEGGDTEALLDEVKLPEDTYTSIRLRVSANGSGDDSFIVLTGGGTEALKLESEDEDGLKIDDTSFRIEDSEKLTLVVDFDLRKSIREPDGEEETAYQLIPVLRLVDEDDAGSIGGTVSPALIGTDCTPAVYVYAGHGATADDVGGTNEPRNTGRVSKTTGAYRVSFLPEGNYTVAWTCAADQDEPGENNAVTFENSTDATVTAQQEETVDFSAAP